MKARPYQLDAAAAIRAAWDGGHRAALATLATGLGKTFLAAMVALERRASGRTMFLAHREELIWQAAETFAYAFDGEPPEIEMAERRADVDSMFGGRAAVVLSTVQTQYSGAGGAGRMTNFNPDDFGLLIVDEAHHYVAPSYKRVIDYYMRNPRLVVLGITATPDRADKLAMGRIFSSAPYSYDIRAGIDGGWLVPIDQWTGTVTDLDLSGVRTSKDGDLNADDLAEVMEKYGNCYGVADQTIGRVGERRTLIFAASVRHAKILSSIFNDRRPGAARYVYADTPRDERRALLDEYARGKFQFLCNVGIACLDEQTEILTLSGWKGVDAIGPADEVANWDNGRIYFAPAKSLRVRDRRPGERMVILETRNRSIRVTEDHRMLCRTYEAGPFKVRHARDVVGRACQLPVSGNAEPIPQSITTTVVDPSTIKARIRSNSYTLRKCGMGADESRTVAVAEMGRRIGMTRKQPSELSPDECRWIGFWIGDGTRTKLAKGGVEYVVCQGEGDAEIIEWFDRLSISIGLSFRKRIQRRPGKRPLVRWSFCRGTGGRGQRRAGGVFHLEPYMVKTGTPLFWALDDDQFAALLHGLWMADGNHGRGEPSLPDVRSQIYGTNRGLFDLLQAIAVCRGYKSNIFRKRQSNPNASPLYAISFSRRESHRMTKHRMRFEPEPWRPERVWCVVTDSTFLIARRRGTVTIMGNTEGFDDPGIECVVVARPTKSRALYTQMAGRGTRVLSYKGRSIVDGIDDADDRKVAIAESAKPAVELIDFVGNAGKHKLITAADILGGDYDSDVVRRVKAKALDAAGPINVTEELAKERAAVLAEREAEERRKADRLARVRVQSRCDFQPVDPFAHDNRANPARRNAPVPRGGGPTEKMREFLAKHGPKNVDPDAISIGEAGKLIREIRDRWDKGLCSVKQSAVLKRAGLPDVVPKETAAAWLDRLANNQWRVPADVRSEASAFAAAQTAGAA